MLGGVMPEHADMFKAPANPAQRVAAAAVAQLTHCLLTVTYVLAALKLACLRLCAPCLPLHICITGIHLLTCK